MNDYKEFQFGWLIFAFVLPSQAVITYLFINNLGDRPMGITVFIVINLIILLTYLLFYGMTTMINSDWIIISFGIGIIKKRIQLNRIRSIKTVKSPWYYGWGIRLIPNGMLYNITGFDNVELIFHNTNRVIRIGTADSSRLKQEILKRLN